MKRKVWFSPLFLWVALSPALFQTSYSCARGNTFLLSLEVEVSGQDQIVNFSTTTRSYAVTIDSSTATVSVVTQDPASNATYRWFVDGTAIGPALPIGVGGGQVTVTVPDGQSQLYVNVQAPEGAFDSYVVDVEQIDPVPAADIPMYCHYANFFGAGTQYVPTEFELTVDPIGPVSGGASFDAEISGFVKTSDLLFSAFSSALGGSSRIAVWDGETTVLPRSGAVGPSVVLQLAPLPTTCAYDANGRIDIAAGPFPSCDPANNTGTPSFEGSFANTDCIGLGGMPSPGNPCLPFRDYSVIDGSGDGCAQCAALGQAYEGLCISSGFCTYLGDPNFPLTTVTATFDAEFSASALFGFDEGGFSPPFVPALGDGLSIAVGGGGSAPGSLLLERNECYMGVAGGPNLDIATPLPDSALVSIPVELTPFPCTEQGILDAIAAGGGPHTFDCAGPTTVATTATIDIDNDVSLDGEGNLTLQPGGTHGVLMVPVGTTAELRGATITGNGGATAGIPVLNQGALTLRDVDFIDNLTQDQGVGALLNDGGSLTVVGGTFLGNDVVTTMSTPLARDIGTVAGVANLVGVTVEKQIGHEPFFGPGELNVFDSQIGFLSGVGGLTAYYPTTLLNTTVLGVVVGGGKFVNSTVEIFFPQPEATTFRNTIVSTGCFGDTGSLVSEGHNIAGSLDCGFTDPTDQANVTPAQLNLGPLQDNGGPTQTLLPGPGSVAIDAIPPADCLDADGLPLTTDQRGIPRPQGTNCDIGAVEVEQP